MGQKINKIYFRADGNKNMGLGHIIRSLALAEMLTAQYECHFMTSSMLPFLENQILAVCESIVQLPTFNSLLEEGNYITTELLTGKEIVVIDGYHFQTAYQKKLKSTGVTLVAIDDIHHTHFIADLLINHSGAVRISDYSAENYTQFCLGTPYALLRKPFRDLPKKTIPKKLSFDTVFICLGGADPKNHTLSVIKKLQSLKKFKQYYVILGGAYTHRKAFDEYLTKSDLPIQILSNLSAQEMVDYMQKSSIAITPPSSISYEYLSIGGLLLLIQIADNQTGIKQFLIDNELAYNLEDFDSLTEKNWKKSLSIQQDYFDGKQAKRLLKQFNQTQVKIRKVQAQDCQQIYDWANDPSVRQQSFNAAPIPYEVHKNWFFTKIKDPNCAFYIGEINDIPFGPIRFDIKKDLATISYSVDAQFRGQGLGTILLKKGKEKVEKEAIGFKQIVGFVKKENLASQRAFLKLGYQQEIDSNNQHSFKFALAI